MADDLKNQFPEASVIRHRVMPDPRAAETSTCDSARADAAILEPLCDLLGILSPLRACRLEDL